VGDPEEPGPPAKVPVRPIPRGGFPTWLKPRSVLSGRIRWDAPVLHRAPELAAELERQLLRRPGIELVRANPLTGRLLVYHAGHLSVPEVAFEIRAALGEAVGLLRPAPHRHALARAEPSPELARTLVLGGGALAGGALVALTVGSLTPLLVGASVFTLTLAVNEVTRLVGPERAAQPRTVERLLTFARPYRRPILTAAGYAVGSVLFSLTRVFFIGSAVDLLVRQSTLAAAGRSMPHLGLRVATLGGIGLVSNAIYAALEYAGNVQWQTLSEEAKHRLRLEVYDHIQKLEVSNLERRRRGELLTILSEDIQRIEGLSKSAWKLFRMVVQVLPTCVVYIFIAPRVAWVTLAWVPVILRASAHLQRQTRPLIGAAAERQGLLSAHLSESLQGYETIKSLTLEKQQLERVQRIGREGVRDSARAIEVGAAFGPLLEVMIMGGTVTTMAGAAMLGGPGMTGGTYSMLLMFTGQLFWPLTELGNVAGELQRALASLDRVYDLLGEEVEERSGTLPLDPRAIQGEVVVDDVVFGYKPGTPVLRGVNLRFAAGRTTAIVGPTGSGKSTIAKLLLRFHEAGEGAVLLDGEDVRNFLVRDLRRSVALVSQTPFLFYGSVRENIALGDPAAPLADVRQAAQRAHASRFIEALPQAYESQVEEYGQKLSGGERQRIALARALIRDAPVLLLDEATSQVDNNTEAAILASLREIRKGRTTIVIAHRLSAVRDADYIYVLDHGQVVEEGSHGELVRLGGTYAALWHLQSGPPHSAPPHGGL